MACAIQYGGGSELAKCSQSPNLTMKIKILNTKDGTYKALVSSLIYRELFKHLLETNSRDLSLIVLKKFKKRFAKRVKKMAFSECANFVNIAIEDFNSFLSELNKKNDLDIKK